MFKMFKMRGGGNTAICGRGPRGDELGTARIKMQLNVIKCDFPTFNYI